MIKSPHLRALAKMVLSVSIVTGLSLGIAYGLDYIYIAYGWTGIVNLFATIICLVSGGFLYKSLLEEEKRKQ